MTVTAMLAQYGAEDHDVARVRRLLAAEPDPWRRDLPLHLTASAFVVHPATRRVLLRWHERQQAWLQVGGHGDPGERDPLAVALREGREETGLPDLTPWPDDSLLQVAVVPVPAKGAEPAHEHADLRFVLATTQPEAIRPEKPEAPLRWLPVDEALEATGEANVREALSWVRRLLGA
ncbi:8-oxo-dGTP pyrophosphatase MutT, NUDIX family [Amycolatopsis sacchari]|uniref:8-oxo-dGTP pyrophosphatase MutT, NUDIX family n=1 Tax=Amycolatopsis sacchari TaxID=115433 RepID=A0A1I3PUG2_9PSEU|nr:NUDIX domain-containing protein [Amycolatopsis sacchari]SFJ24947.1 8-oxo-dGTP pyrophosphatase MutT, NUDIX family [Amycolatopsis sacchari]